MIGFFDAPGFGLVFSNMEASKIQQQQSWLFIQKTHLKAGLYRVQRQKTRNRKKTYTRQG